MTTRSFRQIAGFIAYVVTAVVTLPVQTWSATVAAPAHWTLTGLPAKPLAKGASFHLTLECRIEPGWHIYALEEPEGGPVATQVGLDANDPVQLLAVDQSPPKMVPDVFYREKTALFEEQAKFDLQLKLPKTPIPRSTVLHVIVRYQSCNDRICLVPRRETIELPLAPLLR